MVREGYPRLRGKCFQDEDGKWYWDLLLTTFGDSDNGNIFRSNEKFASRELAYVDMVKAIKTLSEALNPDIEFIDNKTNIKFNWNKPFEN